MPFSMGKLVIHRKIPNKLKVLVKKKTDANPAKLKKFDIEVYDTSNNLCLTLSDFYYRVVDDSEKKNLKNEIELIYSKPVWNPVARNTKDFRCENVVRIYSGIKNDILEPFSR